MATEGGSKHEADEDGTASYVVGLGLLFVAWTAVVLVVGRAAAGDGGYTLGTFGDAFGPLAAFFNAAAFAATFGALTLQRRELALQRKAMKDQHDEMTRQTEAAARYAKAIETANELAQEANRTVLATNELARHANRTALAAVRVRAAALVFEAETAGTTEVSAKSSDTSEVDMFRRFAACHRAGISSTAPELVRKGLADTLARRPRLATALDLHGDASDVLDRTIDRELEANQPPPPQ